MFAVVVGIFGLSGCGTHSATGTAGNGDSAANASAPQDGGATDAATDGATSGADLSIIVTGPRTWSQLLAYTDALHAMKYVGGFVYAVDSAADSVEVWNASTHAHVTTIPVGHVPGDLATDGTYLYVANMLAREFGDDYLSVIDPASQTVIATSQVTELDWGNDPDNDPVTNFPTNVTVLGHEIYVVFPANAVPGLIPVAVGSLDEDTYQAAGSAPANLAGIGDLLVITNLKALGNFTDDDIRIQRTDGTLLQTLETGGKLHDAITIEDRVWVAHAPLSAPGDLLVIDPTTGDIEHVATAAGTYGLASSGGLIYVTCTDAARVQTFDTKTHTLVEDVDLAAVAPMVVNARGISAAPNGDIYLESDGMISLLSH